MSSEKQTLSPNQRLPRLPASRFHSPRVFPDTPPLRRISLSCAVDELFGAEGTTTQN